MNLGDLKPGDIFRLDGRRYRLLDEPETASGPRRARWAECLGSVGARDSLRTGVRELVLCEAGVQQEFGGVLRAIASVTLVRFEPPTRWLGDEVLRIVAAVPGSTPWRPEQWDLGVDEDSLLVTLRGVYSPRVTTYEAPTTLAALGEALSDICHGRSV